MVEGVKDKFGDHDEEKQPLVPLAKPTSAADPDNPWIHGMAGLSSTTVIILYYALCSSTMLVINKVRMRGMYGSLYGTTPWVISTMTIGRSPSIDDRTSF